MNVGQIHQVLIPVAALAVSGMVGLIVKIIFSRIKKNEDESKEIKGIIWSGLRKSMNRRMSTKRKF